MIKRRSLLAFAILLPACGYRPKKPLAPPRVTITGLRQSGGKWLVKLRLQNLVEADMHLDRLDLQLTTADQQIQIQRGPPMTILPALATDVVEQAIPISRSAAQALATATANGVSVPYQLSGHAFTDEPQRRFEVIQEGFLSAVPGRANEYR